MLIRTTLATVILLWCAVASAHHGWTGYDESRTLTLTGTVTESAWSNPHGTIRLKTKDATWKVILAPVSRMEGRGMKREMVAKGATVTVVGYAHREHKGELRAERIKIGKSSFELR
jgi:Family of unknown function (DUF6152)